MHTGHDPDHHRNGSAGIGHNAPPEARPAQWQTPHRPAEMPPAEDRVVSEADIDLVERAFAEGFTLAADPTSFLRLARVPFSARGSDGMPLVLLRVELDTLTDVGSVTPHVGGSAFRYDPLPAAAVSRRRRLRFAYFDGTAVRHLTFGEVRVLAFRSEPATHEPSIGAVLPNP